MATDYSWLRTMPARQVNVLTDAYFGGDPNQEAAQSLGDGSGAGYLDWTRLPGYESFFTPKRGVGDSETSAWVDRYALDRYLRDNDYKVMSLQEEVGKGNPASEWRWLQDSTGNFLVEPQRISSNDNAFWGAANLLGGMVAGPMIASGLGGGLTGAIGGGALTGGVGALGGGGDLKDILKGAALGGLGGGIGHYAGNLANEYLPSVETFYDSTAFNPSEPQFGNGAFLGEGVPSGIPQWDEAWGNLNIPSVGPRPSVGNMEGLTPTIPDNTGDYRTEGRNYPTPESTQPGGGLGGSPAHTPANLPFTQVNPSGTWDKILDFAKTNPQLASQLLGLTASAASKLFGGGGSGSGPTTSGPGPQAGMTANAPAAFQRQYIAPPAGHRPGFDPEHRYFTGIGSVGLGG